MKIYDSYDDEPGDIFSPLPPSLYVDFYDVEMNDFALDLAYYLSCLQPGSRILEAGCGSGRLSRLLQPHDCPLLGIDLSVEMLTAAKKKSSGLFCCMDMRNLAFDCKFRHIIIPYNTLNLLCSEEDIHRCLLDCHRHLLPNGTLLLQLYIPPRRQSKTDDKATFQFQLFDLPDGGRLIKEILQYPCPGSDQITIEQRYRLRPMEKRSPHCDYQRTYRICGWSHQQWVQSLKKAGFLLEKTFTSYTLDAVHDEDSTIFLVSAIPSPTH